MLVSINKSLLTGVYPDYGKTAMRKTHVRNFYQKKLIKGAFETTPKNILLQKLQKYGAKGTELKWIASYLTKRKLITKVNNMKPNKCKNKLLRNSSRVKDIHKR